MESSSCLPPSPIARCLRYCPWSISVHTSVCSSDPDGHKGKDDPLTAHSDNFRSPANECRRQPKQRPAAGSRTCPPSLPCAQQQGTSSSAVHAPTSHSPHRLPSSQQRPVSPRKRGREHQRYCGLPAKGLARGRGGTGVRGVKRCPAGRFASHLKPAFVAAAALIFFKGGVGRRQHRSDTGRPPAHRVRPTTWPQRGPGQGGRFRTARAQRAHSANYYAAYPRNTPENHPPTEACMIHSKQHRGCRIQDHGTHGKHQTKNTIPGVSAGAVWCRIQDPGTLGYRWWKTADFSHSARTARAQRTVRPHGSRAGWGPYRPALEGVSPNLRE